MKDTNKIILAIVLLAGSLVLILLLSGKGIRYAANNDQQGQPNNRKITAPAGELVSGFPKTLALDATAKVSESFSISYDKFGQYTANFVSTKSVSDEYNAYLNYLKANNFQIINKDLQPAAAHLYGIKTGADVNITISKATGQTNVLVSYLSK